MTVAVLFLIFNRIYTTRQVLDAIRQAAPPRLYIASDGPRKNIEGEDERVKAVREHVVSSIDWDCEVKSLFRDENLGCKKAITSAIDYFFENEEAGIILEDDCIPNKSFFYFCEEMLIRYKDDERVMHIGGCNFQNGIKRGNGSYYFSKATHVWGWATWHRAWKYYDPHMSTFPEFVKQNRIANTFCNPKMRKYMLRELQFVFDNKIEAWDTEWTYSVWSQNGLAILPNVNLITNIGFGHDATHTTDEGSRFANMPREEMEEIIHPTFMLPDLEADLYTARQQFIPQGIFTRGLNKLKFPIKVSRCHAKQRAHKRINN
jgi:hypothetical protein